MADNLAQVVLRLPLCTLLELASHASCKHVLLWNCNADLSHWHSLLSHWHSPSADYGRPARAQSTRLYTIRGSGRPTAHLHTCLAFSSLDAVVHEGQAPLCIGMHSADLALDPTTAAKPTSTLSYHQLLQLHGRVMMPGPCFALLLIACVSIGCSSSVCLIGMLKL